MYESEISRQNLNRDVGLAGAVTMVRLIRPDCATLKRPRLIKTSRLRLLPSNPLPFCQLNPICQARNTRFLNRKGENYLDSKFILHITQAMTDNNDDNFNTQMLAAIESNDLATLQNMLSTREAEGPNALQRGHELTEALSTALELARFDMAEELFKRGARWGDSTIMYVSEGAREENGWNTKAIDVALAHGWDINEHFDHIGCALV
jgi:hypothetical protein